MSTTATKPTKRTVCDGCGGSLGQIEAAAVADLVTGQQVELWLCGRCRGSRYRTWRRRYEPAGASVSD